MEFTPPRIAAEIDKSTSTRDRVTASGGIGLCLPGAAMVDLTSAVGSASSRTLDTFERFRIGRRLSV